MKRLLIGAACILGVFSLQAATFQERFESDPVVAGWKTFGNGALFQWNQGTAALEVRWDSSQPNSYFYRPLGTVLSKEDDFAFSFDLRLSELSLGITPGKPLTFELAVALLNLRDATNANFQRGSGHGASNLVEFDYFPDSGFGATISPVIVSSNNAFAAAFSFPMELTLADVFHIQMRYEAAARTLSTTMLRNGEPFGPIKPVTLSAAFTDFRVDALAITSYSDAGADGSLLATGTVDNIVISTPDPPLATLSGGFRDGHWTVSLNTVTQWSYTLERTDDYRAWRQVSPATEGTGEQIELRDAESAAGGRAFYRVRLERP